MRYNNLKKISSLLTMDTLITLFNHRVSVIQNFHRPHWYRFIRLSQGLEHHLLFFLRCMFLDKTILLYQIIKSFSLPALMTFFVVLAWWLNLAAKIQSVTDLLNFWRQLTRTWAALTGVNLIIRFGFLTKKCLILLFFRFTICGQSIEQRRFPLKE